MRLLLALCTLFGLAMAAVCWLSLFFLAGCEAPRSTQPLQVGVPVVTGARGTFDMPPQPNAIMIGTGATNECHLIPCPDHRPGCLVAHWECDK